MKRFFRRQILLNIVVLSLTLLSCASDPKVSLKEQSGISACKAAVAKRLDSERDVFRYEVSAKIAECIPALQQSIVEASKGECRGLIDARGSCSYSFGNKTAMAERARSADDFSRYEVRSW
jgi:hypothetical protein